jgi:uncharacterized protein (DUF302 family)
MATNALAPELVTKLSPWSVADTLARLSAILADKGIKLFATIDHSGEAQAAGLELRETKVVIFGSPLAGTPVMQAAPLAALDLPLKVLVWADELHAPGRSRQALRTQRRSGREARSDRRHHRRGHQPVAAPSPAVPATASHPASSP